MKEITGAASVIVIASLTMHLAVPPEDILPCNPATELCEQQLLTLSDDPAPRPQPEFLRELAVTQSTAVMSGSALAASFATLDLARSRRFRPLDDLVVDAVDHAGEVLVPPAHAAVPLFAASVAGSSARDTQ
jgi:hypothetical protein